MGRPLYVDLDETLIASSVRGGDVKIYPRPGVQKFLEQLSRHGDLFLLTHATRPHVEDAFKALGPVSGIFQGVVSREDMEPIIEQIDYIVQDPRLTMAERGMLYQEIQPIMPRGYVFDDQPVGSELYLIKSAVVGARPKDWIQVKAFKRGVTAGQELKRAYQEYRRRVAGPHTALSGRAVRVTG